MGKTAEATATTEASPRAPQGVVVKEPWTLRRMAWALTPPILHEMYKKAVGR